ncbi:MAG: membrane protein insertase YidC [Acidobacteriota bacterium]
MDNRRLLFAFFLSLLVFVIWSMLFPPTPPVQPEREPTTVDQAASPDRAGPGDEATPTTEQPAGADEIDLTTTEAPPGEADGVVREPVLPPIVAVSEQSVVVTTGRAVAEFTNRGAQLVRYSLDEHLDEEGAGLNLIRARGNDLYPFALLENGRSSALNGVYFVGEQGTDDEGMPVVTFRYRGPAGEATKTFRWRPHGFIDVEIEAPDAATWSVLLGPGITDQENQSGYGQQVTRAVGYRRGGETELIEADDTDEDVVLGLSGLEWVTLEDNFFLNAVIPDSGLNEVRVRPVFERPAAEQGRPRFLPIDTSADTDDLTRELLVVLRADGDATTFRAFFGAKKYSELAALPYGLEQTVRWGFLEFLAKPLYIILEWTHDTIVPNWGWAIVLVTILIKLLFFPLTHKSQMSMGRMQELNPKVQAIRQKFRSKLRDKQGRPNIEAQQQMNQEIMAVYKSAGVNPASGCFPILLQMPVFFAFYRLLLTAVELRGAEWILWIHDLSIPDPYFILPLLMGATSLAMQRMMPSSPDAMQRRIMQIMPIAFTAFAFYFPAGLVLYWLTNNLLTTGQQALINRMRAGQQSAEAVSR